MAQETLVKEQLTPWDLLGGYSLTKRLLETDFELVCSFWLYTSESNSWRLFLSSPRVEAVGLLASYEKVRRVLVEEPNTNWASLAITVVRDDVPLVRAIRSLGKFRIPDLPAGPGTYIPAPKRVSTASVDGVFIEDAYIYFIG